jgi:hypothetical protein
MSNNCTLVTCCYDTSKFNKHSRSISNIIESIDIVLTLPIYLVIFTEDIFVELIKEKRKTYGLNEKTLIISSKLEDIWTFKYLDIVKKNRDIYHSTKDARTSAESHLITCNKFDFVLQIIELNPFNTSKFGWIDSFLGKNNSLRICENYTTDKFLYVLNNITDKFHIQILNVNDKKYKLVENKKEYYQTYRYVVCGGFFTCGKEIGLKILNRLKDIFVETTELGYGHGEEMLYLEILDEYYDDIERGYGDYGQIINNIIYSTCNLNYIDNLIIKRYLNFGYHKECYDCCKKVIYGIENLNINYEPDTYISILFSYYISSFYHKYDESLQIINHIYDVCNKNEILMQSFNKKKDFYESQFKYRTDSEKL